MEVIDRFFNPPPGSFFLLGPRGTGKSLWTRRNLPDALRIDLLDPESFRLFQAKPERLRERLAAETKPRDVVIDEVQRVPEILSVVHALMEEDRSLRFVLTGSSARKLRRAGVDLLAGRATVCTLHPFLAAELASRFTIGNALREGLLPVVVGSERPADALKGYSALYLREEVQQEGLVRNLGAFSRFLEAASFSHAQPLNLASVARECQVERKVAEGYLSVLEDLLLAFRVPVFARRARRALAAHPKLYFFDAGVYRSLRPVGPIDRPEEIEGAALEGLVAQHLRAWIAYRDSRNDLFYWRSRGGLEVDLVVYGEDGLTAVEVKNSRRVRPEDLRALRAFGVDYPEAKRFLLYRGGERLRIDGIQCLPCAEFLSSVRPEKPLA
jgi:uncharacterized protein